MFMHKNAYRSKISSIPGGYSVVPNWSYDDSWDYKMKTVFHHLLRFRNNKTGQCNPSQETLAKKIGMSKPTVERQIRKLKASGWIRTTRTRYSCQYSFPFLDSSPMTNLDSEESSEAELGFVTSDGSRPSQEMDKQSEEKKNIEQERLFYDGHKCTALKSGVLMIQHDGNRWIAYRGENDDLFSFGNLRGVEAKDAYLQLDSSQS